MYCCGCVHVVLTFFKLKCFGLGLVMVFFFLKRGCKRSPLLTVSAGLCSNQFSDNDLFLPPALLYNGGFYYCIQITDKTDKNYHNYLHVQLYTTLCKEHMYSTCTCISIIITCTLYMYLLLTHAWFCFIIFLSFLFFKGTISIITIPYCC